MSRANVIQTNFTAGEISPRAAARVDISKYQNGAFLLDNFMVQPQGGATRRPGTRFVASTKHNNKDTRLIPFKFSTTQNYQIEMGDQYFRFFKDNGQIESSPGVPYEVATTYLEADIRRVRFAQSADVLFLTHKSYAPRKLTRTGHTAWTLTELDFQDGPYLDTNVTATTITPSATTGNITLTASTAIFAASDVGRLVRIKNGGTWGWVKITAFTSTTVVSATVRGTLGGVGATTDWRLGAWSTTTGWPTAVVFYEDRLWFAGTTNQPQTLYASKSGAYEIFSPTQTDGSVTDDNGIVYTINTNDVNEIRWMSAGKVLSVLTSAGEFTVAASNLNEAITPSNIKVTNETNRGVNHVRPVRIDSTVLMWQRSGRKLRQYRYSFQYDSFESKDATILAEHITKSGVIDADYQQEPYAMVWCALTNGMLISLTYDIDQDVVGWCRHTLGGTNAKAKAVSVIPSVDTTYDELWLITTRTVNGATLQAVEYLLPEVDPEDETDKNDMIFADCSLSYNGAPTTTISGLTHLVGETVSVIGDGNAQTNKVVSGGGTITLDRAASVVHVGLFAKPRLKSVRWEYGGNAGTSQAKPGRIHQLGIRFLNTLGCKFGPDENHLEQLIFRKPSDPMGSSPPLFTGDKVVSFPSDYGLDRQVYVESDLPYPITVLGLLPEMVVYG